MAASSESAVNTYDPYGVPAAGNVGRFQYTGQAWIPELAMYYYKARIYAPSLGRFMQTDPVGYKDQVNLYAYAGNDPVNGADPSGDCACRGNGSFGEWSEGNNPDDYVVTIQAADQNATPNGQSKPTLENRIVETVSDHQASTFGEYAEGVGSEAVGALEDGAIPDVPSIGPAVSEVESLTKGGVYALRDAEGVVVRTGRTIDLARRRVEHARDALLQHFDFEDVFRTDIHSEQRGLEQILHEQFSPLLNKIRPISPTNPNLENYMKAAQDFLAGFEK